MSKRANIYVPEKLKKETEALISEFGVARFLQAASNYMFDIKDGTSSPYVTGAWSEQIDQSIKAMRWVYLEEGRPFPS